MPRARHASVTELRLAGGPGARRGRVTGGPAVHAGLGSAAAAAVDVAVAVALSPFTASDALTDGRR